MAPGLLLKESVCPIGRAFFSCVEILLEYLIHAFLELCGGDTLDSSFKHAILKLCVIVSSVPCAGLVVLIVARCIDEPRAALQHIQIGPKLPGAIAASDMPLSPPCDSSMSARPATCSQGTRSRDSVGMVCQELQKTSQLMSSLAYTARRSLTRILSSSSEMGAAFSSSMMAASSFR